MIIGEWKSAEIEGMFVEFYEAANDKVGLLGDILVNAKVSNLEIAHRQLQPLNLKTEEFEKFIRDERRLNRRDYDSLVEKYNGSNTYDRKVMDLVYMHDGKVKAFAELNGIYHFYPVHGWKTLYEVLASDYAKRCMASQLSIPFLEFNVKNNLLSFKEVVNVLSFFKQTE